MKRNIYPEEDIYARGIFRMRQKKFLFFYAALLLFVSGVLLFVFKENAAVSFHTSVIVIITTSVFLGLLSIGIVLNLYLTATVINLTGTGFTDVYDAENINALLNRHLKKNITDKYGFASGEHAEVLRKGEAEPEKLFLNSIEDIKFNYLLQFTCDVKYAKPFEDLYSLEQKIKNQIARLISNSNLNLILGTLTTLIGIIILGVSIFQKNSFATSLDLLSHYIPRLSTVILIEVFAFFFLNLYRKNLDEIKYFQNELSNLSFKIASLKSALILNDKQCASEIINEFSKVERNFILKKDETTEKLELEKIDSHSKTNLIEKISDIITSLKK